MARTGGLDAARIERERALIGAILIDPSILREVGLRAGDFRTPEAHAIVIAIERVGLAAALADDFLLRIHEEIHRSDALADALRGDGGSVAARLSELLDTRELATPRTLARWAKRDALEDEIRLLHGRGATGEDVELEIGRCRRELARLDEPPDRGLPENVLRVEIHISESASSERLALRAHDALLAAAPSLAGRIRICIVPQTGWSE